MVQAMLSEAEIQAIDELLGETKSLFTDGYNNVIKAAYHHDFLPTLVSLLKKVYFQRRAIHDPRIVEALLSISLYNCSNKYCYVIHSGWLLRQGLSFSQVTNIREFLELPDELPDHERFSKLLKLSFFAFREKNLSIENLRVVRELLSEDEFWDFGNIISLGHFLEFLVTTFSDEINLEKEAIIRDSGGRTLKEFADFVQYYEAKEAKLAREYHQIPVFVICSYCKSLKDIEGNWHPIESIISRLPPELAFSHGICEDCLKKYTAATAS